jgi:hypothetical protein
MRMQRHLARLARVWLALAACAAPAATAPQEKPEEKFEKLDPYTRGAKAELARAGIESFGPFHWADDIETQDIVEILGSPQVLWIETAHFKLGSTLPTYDCPSDDIEQQKLKAELARLSKRLARVRREPDELDPWLRLHLYAQRLEEQYADFLARFGLREEEFEGKPGATADLGPGRYLGQELKYTVLLTHKGAPLARAGKRWLGYDEQGYYRGLLPGGSWFLGASTEALAKIGCESDSGLHALVAYALAENLCDGFRGTKREKPLWWKHGLGLYYSRRIEERWSVHVPRAATGSEADSWRWEPRLHGLVSNDFVPGFDEMLAWPNATTLEAPQHMSTWSRVSWLLGLEKAELRAFLVAISEPIDPGLSEEERRAALTESGKRALRAGFGKSPAELDQAWRKWVLKKYPKR